MIILDIHNPRCQACGGRDNVRIKVCWFGGRYVPIAAHLDACWNSEYHRNVDRMLDGDWPGYGHDPEVVEHGGLAAE